MGMSHHREFMGVSFIHDRLDLVHRHLVLVDQLDDIDAGVGYLFHFGLGVGCAFDSPPERFRAGIRLMLNEWSGHIQGWPWNFTAVDSIPNLNAGFQWRTEVAGTRNAGH